MAETFRIVDYYYLMCPDKPGEGARLLSEFRDAGINFLAVHAFPKSGRVQVDMVPEDTAAFLKAARKAKLKLSQKKKAFLAAGEDRVGVMASILGRLAEAGINLTAVTTLCAGKGRFGALFWVKPRDLRRTSKALGIGVETRSGQILETFTYRGWTVNLKPTHESLTGRWCAGFVLLQPGRKEMEKLTGRVEDPRGFCYGTREEALRKSRALAFTYIDHGHSLSRDS
ncbi:MAG: hypothetical protein ACE5JS_11025 [Nitrospinota bacterium]